MLCMHLVKEFITVNILSNGYKYFIQDKETKHIFGGCTRLSSAEFYARMCDNGQLRPIL